MPGAESVTMLFSEWVETSPSPGKASISRRPFGSPAVTPYLTMRAAVRWETPMPSPSRMMMFFASPSSLSPESPTTWTVDSTEADPVASVKVAVSLCRPGLPKAWARTLNPPQPAWLMPSVVLVFWAPEVKATGLPSTDRVAAKGPVPAPSTRMSKRCPSRRRAPLGGTRATLVGAANAGRQTSAANNAAAVREMRKCTLMGPFLLRTSIGFRWT
jgi:hypothetical protein